MEFTDKKIQMILLTVGGLLILFGFVGLAPPSEELSGRDLSAMGYGFLVIGLPVFYTDFFILMLKRGGLKEKEPAYSIVRIVERK